MTRSTPHQDMSPISFCVNVARLPQKGMPLEIDATEEQRRELAEIHDLLEVKRLHVSVQIVPWRRNGVSVSGVVDADIVQSCIVTLEAIQNHVREEIDQVFLPQDSKLGRQGFEGGGEILLDAEGDDGPETFAGDSIDIGALAEEFFGLGIDPYPRKADATLEIGVESDADEPVAGPLQEKLASLLRKDDKPR